MLFLEIIYIHIHVPSASYPEASHEVDTALALQSRGMIRSQETFGDGEIKLSDVRCLFLQGDLGQPREVFIYTHIFFLVRCKHVLFFGIKVDVFFLMVPFDQ